MELYSYIRKRKSTRRYDMTPLSEEVLNQVLRYTDSLKPLYPDIRTEFEIITDVRQMMSVKAPHYLVISSENKDGYHENAGFLMQQMDLFFSASGLGSCWLGMSKPAGETKSRLPWVITLAFGNAEESPYRGLSEFRRRTLSEISGGYDESLEAARLAPSSLNSQNWFFSAEDGRIDVYQKKTVMTRIYGRLNKIDIGIALCHIYLAAEHSNLEFAFSEEEKKDKKGYVYAGTVIQTVRSC